MHLRALTYLAALVVALPAEAGLISAATARTADWKLIERTGGMRIGRPEAKDGSIRLPIDYNVSGARAVTRPANTINSSWVVRRVRVSVIRPGVISLRVVYSLADGDFRSAEAPPADLSDIPPGEYTVHYGSPDHPAALLGHITIPQR